MNQQTKLLLLDKDGTLVAPKSGDAFVKTPWDQSPLPGAEAAIAHYLAAGWKPIIISNQGGIAAKHKSLEDCFAEMRFCLELFPGIEEAYFCPDFEGLECWRVWGDCNTDHRIRYGQGDLPHRIVSSLEEAFSGSFRKPGAGMLKLAIDIHTPEQILYVGDRPEDEGAAIAAGVSFLWANEWRLSV